MIVAADLDVDGRGHAQVDDRIHQAAGLEVSGDSGRSSASLRRTRSMYSKLLELVLLLQAYLHEGRVLAGVAGVDGGEVGRHADVGDDHAADRSLAMTLADVLAPRGPCTGW